MLGDFKYLSEFLSFPIAGARRRLAFSTSYQAPEDLPRKDIRVFELGQLIAGPFAGQLLGQFGAEIIKVEPPGTGGPLRVWRELDMDGTSPWWRNKKSVAIDLRKTEGRELVRKPAIMRKPRTGNTRTMVPRPRRPTPTQPLPHVHPREPGTAKQVPAVFTILMHILL